MYFQIFIECVNYNHTKNEISSENWVFGKSFNVTNVKFLPFVFPGIH